MPVIKQTAVAAVNKQAADAAVDQFVDNMDNTEVTNVIEVGHKFVVRKVTMTKGFKCLFHLVNAGEPDVKYFAYANPFASAAICAALCKARMESLGKPTRTVKRLTAEFVQSPMTQPAVGSMLMKNDFTEFGVTVEVDNIEESDEYSDTYFVVLAGTDTDDVFA